MQNLILKNTRLVPFLTAAVSAALFGMATPLSKLLLDQMNPFMLAGFLYLGAGVGLLPFLFLKRNRTRPVNTGRKSLVYLTGAVILGGIAGPLLLLAGLSHASASSVSLWLNLELVFTAILGVIFFQDHLGPFSWAGVAVAGTAGIILSFHQGASGFYAVLLISAACVCWGLDNHFTSLIDGITAVQSTTVKGLIAGTVNIIIGYFMPGSDIQFKTIAFSLGVGALSYGISIVLYIVSAQKMGATRAQVLFSTSPVFGIIGAVFILNESLSSFLFVSAGLFTVSVCLMLYDPHKHVHRHKKMTHVHPHSHKDRHHNHTHESDERKAVHIHEHTHEEGAHSHSHMPDLHHRHEHGKK